MRYQTFATFSMVDKLPVQPSSDMREIAECYGVPVYKRAGVDAQQLNKRKCVNIAVPFQRTAQWLLSVRTQRRMPKTQSSQAETSPSRSPRVNAGEI